jgi:dihydropteroate synthase
METVMDCAGKKLDLAVPAVMGILNLTPDSFYSASRVSSPDDLLQRAEKMISEGAAILDIGAVSTRPGAPAVDVKKEMARLEPALKLLTDHFPQMIISVDTYNSAVAEMAISNGAGMINDIYAGSYDNMMIDIIQKHDIPYVMMHMQGNPANMQNDPYYDDVTEDVLHFFKRRIALFPENYRKIIIDPGFGFGKTVQHNYSLLKRLDKFVALGYPVLAGLSRKSMIQRPLKIRSGESLNGTTVLNTIALMNGASILRVHDVREAIEAVRLVNLYREAL